MFAVNKEELERLWCDCFEDPRDVPHDFFSISDVEILTARKNENIVGMANLIPVKINDLDGFYVYGVCVHPSSRGKGFFLKLMQDCEKLAAEKGAHFLCLIAADKRLENSYKKMGYEHTVKSFACSCEGDLLIKCSSPEFEAFAEPPADAEPSGFGLLKPLSKSISLQAPLSFATAMGEV